MFMQTLNELQYRREINVEHCDALRHNDITRRRKTSLSKFDPVSILFEYMHQKQLRVIDLFRNLDLDRSQTITKKEFKEGLMVMFIDINIVLLLIFS